MSVKVFQVPVSRHTRQRARSRFFYPKQSDMRERRPQVLSCRMVACASFFPHPGQGRSHMLSIHALGINRWGLVANITSGEIQIELRPGYFLLRPLVPVQPALFRLASATLTSGFFLLGATCTRCSASTTLTSWLLLLDATGTRLPASTGLSMFFTTSNCEVRT